MNTPALQAKAASTPEGSGVEFGRSADDMPVARVGDLVFATVPGRDGQHFLASAWRVSRPSSELKRYDFYSHHGAVADEAEFRARMFEQAEHVPRPLGARPADCPDELLHPMGTVAGRHRLRGGYRISHHGRAWRVQVVQRSQRQNPCDASLRRWLVRRRCRVGRGCPRLSGTPLRDTSASPPIGRSGISCPMPGNRFSAESHEKDRRAFEREHAGDWIVISALRSDHQPGMTEVIATIGGVRAVHAEERRFFVPSDEYEVGRFGFVIDTARHAGHDGPSSFISWQPRVTGP
ncbi:hypothetical protein ACVIGV_005050 [Rhizobium leguminosarum]